MQRAVLIATTTAVMSCAGAQSVLDPAGEAAQDIADLFWGMTIGSLVACG